LHRKYFFPQYTENQQRNSSKGCRFAIASLGLNKPSNEFLVLFEVRHHRGGRVREAKRDQDQVVVIP
jgi:hypothetical protein